jgi:hypothetical protein
VLTRGTLVSTARIDDVGGCLGGGSLVVAWW